MKYSLVIFATFIGISIVTASCKKSEEVKIERIKNVDTLTSDHDSLAGAMKKASRAMRRLARTIENRDWVEMAKWAEEIKENIGFNCVELYMIENNDVSNEFMELSSNFNGALNKLISYSKSQDTDKANIGFGNLVMSCDACHESFNRDAEAKLDFTDSD
jgi:CRISPR/Cas system CSM-associated protein Csm2 small subunit